MLAQSSPSSLGPREDLAGGRPRAAGQRGQQVVADRADVELVELPAAAGAIRATSLSLASWTSWRPSKLKSSAVASIQASSRACGSRSTGRLIEQVVGGDQVLIDGVAQMRQVDPAEGPVPVAAVALAAVQLRAGLFDQLGVDGSPRLGGFARSAAGG